MLRFMHTELCRTLCTFLSRGLFCFCSTTLCAARVQAQKQNSNNKQDKAGELCVATVGSDLKKHRAEVELDFYQIHRVQMQLIEKNKSKVFAP